MTFILNILHKDYSLLVSDRKGSAEGPTTIKMGKITIHAQNGATINGVKKLFLSGSKCAALGIAGNVKDHGYTAPFEQSTSVEGALLILRQHMESFLRVNERGHILSLDSITENQGIVSFFDQEQGRYFTNLHLYSPVHSYTRLYASNEDRPTLFHVGSGSGAFERSVGLEAINTFISSIRGAINLEHCLSWVTDAYRKVSAVDEGTGDSISAVLSSRDKPEFTVVVGG